MDRERKLPSTPDLSPPVLERRRVGRYRFYQLWSAHVQAGGDPSVEEWNAIAAECGIAPPARKVPDPELEFGSGLGDFLARKRGG